MDGEEAASTVGKGGHVVNTQAEWQKNADKVKVQEEEEEEEEANRQFYIWLNEQTGKEEKEKKNPILINRLPFLDLPSPVLISKLFRILVHTTKETLQEIAWIYGMKSMQSRIR